MLVKGATGVRLMMRCFNVDDAVIYLQYWESGVKKQVITMEDTLLSARQ